MGKRKAKTATRATKQTRATKTTTLAYPDRFLRDFLGTDIDTAGVAVNESTARGFSAVYACARNISEDLGALPISVYRMEGSKRQKDLTHYVYELLQRSPSPDLTPISFRESIINNAITWGDGYAEIEREDGLTPSALTLIDPSIVEMLRDDILGIVYRVQLPSETKYIPAYNMIHMHGLGFLGMKGWGLVRIAREAIARGLAAQAFSNKFFRKGCTVSGILEHPARIKPEEADKLRKSFEDKYAGLGNAHNVLAVQDGVKFTPVQSKPADSQLIETLKFSVRDVCTFYRMPESMIQGERSNYSNSEQESLNYVKHTLNPWAVRFEQECNRKLFLPSQKNFYVKFNFNDLLKTDATSTADFGTKMINNGSFSINEFREAFDLEPVEGGDAHYRPANLVDINAPEPEPTPAPRPAPQDQPPEAQPPVDGHRSIIKAWLQHSLHSLVSVERDKVMRAFKQPEYSGWCETFFNSKEHGEYIKTYLKEPIENIDASAVDKIATMHAKRMLEQSKNQELVYGWMQNIGSMAQDYIQFIEKEKNDGKK